MKIPFTKMHGAGNDFIVVDDRNQLFPLQDQSFIRKMASRGTGIGCDGIILLQTSDSADIRMRFLNPDGDEVSMCGNGARCLARFAFEQKISDREMTLETGAGIVCATVLDDGVCIGLTKATDLQLGVSIDLEWTTDFIDTGVPHAVVWVDDLDAINLSVFGRMIREHELFAPKGTNADFAVVEADGTVSVRTYERGVEGETMACGTGAAAVALLASERGKVRLPVIVHCASGFDLVVDSVHGKITLTGGAEFVYEGEVEYGNRI
ncbi:MAG TPA: diaminopimelate epimerase [Pontiella sp.]